MSDHEKKTPPPVLSDDPDAKLEERLRKNPEDCDAKADVSSDESMDASDPPSPSRPGDDKEPSPSSSFPE